MWIAINQARYIDMLIKCGDEYESYGFMQYS